MSTRLMVSLTSSEANALARIADVELRDPREQLRLLLRQELQRRGLLACDIADEQATTKGNPHATQPD